MDALTLDGTGGRHLPVAVEHAHALAARVVQLHEEGTLIGPQGLHQLLIAGNLGVVVNAQVRGLARPVTESTEMASLIIRPTPPFARSA